MSITESPPEAPGRASSLGRTRLYPRTGRHRPERRTQHAIATVEPLYLRRAASDAVRLVSYRLGFSGIADPKGTAWQVLGYREFRRYFLGSVVSNFGTWLQNTAQVLLAYQLGRSVFFVGLVTCAQFSGPLLLGPWAWRLADRCGPRQTLFATQVVSAGIAGWLAILWFNHSLSEPLFLAGAFLTGLMFTFALPAQSVIIPALVPSADTNTKAAMVMNSVSYNVGRSVAPAIGILVVTTVGFGWAFMVNAVSFAVFAVVLLAVRTVSALPAPVRSRLRGSFDVVWNDPKIMILLLMVAAVTVAEDPLLVLGPALARHIGASENWTGYFLSFMGIGSILGSLLPRRKAPSIRRTATALGLLGIFIVIFALAPSIWISAAAAFAAGMAGLVTGSAAQAKLRELAGPGHALQVMGVWTVAWAGSKPIASIIDGALPAVTSVRATGILMALPALIPITVLMAWPGRGETDGRSSSPSARLAARATN